MTGYQLNSRSDMFSSANRLVADRLGERPQKKKKSYVVVSREHNPGTA